MWAVLAATGVAAVGPGHAAGETAGLTRHWVVCGGLRVVQSVGGHVELRSALGGLVKLVRQRRQSQSGRRFPLVLSTIYSGPEAP